jgi:hypothetical protein
VERAGPNKVLKTINLLLGVGFACSVSIFTNVSAADWNAGIDGTLIELYSAIALSDSGN